MLTYESRAKHIVQRLNAGFSSHDIDWVCKEFWRESDIAMKKHILLTLLQAFPDKDLGDITALICRFSDDSSRTAEIVREVYKWSLR